MKVFFAAMDSPRGLRHRILQRHIDDGGKIGCALFFFFLMFECRVWLCLAVSPGNTPFLMNLLMGHIAGFEPRSKHVIVHRLVRRRGGFNDNMMRASLSTISFLAHYKFVSLFLGGFSLLVRDCRVR